MLLRMGDHVESRNTNVSDSELAVLEQLWQLGQATIRQMTDNLYPGGTTAHYATVQKLLERLASKGYVTCQRQKSANNYSARVSRDEFVGSSVRAMAQKLCGGSLVPVLTNLVQAQQLTKDERKSLRQMLDALDANKGRSKTAPTPQPPAANRRGKSS